MQNSRRLLAIILAAVTLLPLGLVAADPGPKAGFRELKWGDRPSKEMRPIQIKKAGMDVYAIRNDDMRIAEYDAALLHRGATTRP